MKAAIKAVVLILLVLRYAQFLGGPTQYSQFVLGEIDANVTQSESTATEAQDTHALRLEEELKAAQELNKIKDQIIASKDQQIRDLEAGKRSHATSAKEEKKPDNLEPAPAATSNIAALDQSKSPEEQEEAYDGFSTPAVQCRLKVEKWQNNNIDHWMKNPPFPLIEWMWELKDGTTNNTLYRGLFNVLMCGRGDCSIDRAKEIISWKWEWQDQFGQYHLLPKMTRRGKTQFPHMFFNIKPESPDLIPQSLRPTFPNGTIPKTTTYDLKPFLECNSIEKANPPPPESKIGACITRFWGQHDLLPEWIAYHKMIGVEHFFFFISEPFESIYDTLPRHEPYITYIPYNFTWDGHRHSPVANKGMFQSPSGYHANGENWFQAYSNSQCLYMARQYGFDWILTPDVDEYISVSSPKVSHFGNPSPLKQVLGQKKVEMDEKKQIQLCLYGGAYSRHSVLETNQNISSFRVSLDFTYRRNKAMGSGEGTVDGGTAGGRKKCFYRPAKVDDVNVHGMEMSRAGPKTSTADVATELELFHIRSPLIGPNKNEIKWLKSYPETRNLYRDKVVAMLEAKQWPFPDFKAHGCRKYNCSSTTK